MAYSRDQIHASYLKVILKYLDKMVQSGLENKSNSEYLKVLRKTLDKIIQKSADSAVINFHPGIEPEKIINELIKLSNEMTTANPHILDNEYIAILSKAISELDVTDPQAGADMLRDSQEIMRKKLREEEVINAKLAQGSKEELLSSLYCIINDAYEYELEQNSKTFPRGLDEMTTVMDDMVYHTSTKTQLILKDGISVDDALKALQNKAKDVKEKYPSTNRLSAMNLIYDAIGNMNFDSDIDAGKSCVKIKRINDTRDQYVRSEPGNGEKLRQAGQWKSIENIEQLINLLLEDEKKRGKWNSRGLQAMKRAINSQKKRMGNGIMKINAFDGDPLTLLRKLQKIAKARLRFQFTKERDENGRGKLYEYLAKVDIEEMSDNDSKFSIVADRINNKLRENEREYLEHRSFLGLFNRKKSSRYQHPDSQMQKKR